MHKYKFVHKYVHVLQGSAFYAYNFLSISRNMCKSIKVGYDICRAFQALIVHRIAELLIFWFKYNIFLCTYHSTWGVFLKWKLKTRYWRIIEWLRNKWKWKILPKIFKVSHFPFMVNFQKTKIRSLLFWWISPYSI